MGHLDHGSLLGLVGCSGRHSLVDRIAAGVEGGHWDRHSRKAGHTVQVRRCEKRRGQSKFLMRVKGPAEYLLVACMALWIARVVGAVLTTCLSVLETTCGWWAIAILPARSTELVLSAVLALLLIVALVVVATVLWLLIIAAVALGWVLVVGVRHV